jgi:hypothetical protein
MKTFKKAIYALGFCLTCPAIVQADVITFNFTGGLVVADQNGNIFINDESAVTPIAAGLIYDTASGLGSSNLSLTMSEGFWSYPVIFHDISMAYQPGTNLITGQVLVDWYGIWDSDGNPAGLNMPLHIEWDATGLFNAIAYGLQPGDIISGTNLYRDANGNGVGEAEEWLADVNSATPYSDVLQTLQGGGPTWSWLAAYGSLQGPAPMAATSGSQGLGPETFQPGIRGYLDIGSGNSMHVVSVSSVPVPAAVWLFGSGLAGLIGFARRKTRAV